MRRLRSLVIIVSFVFNYLSFLVEVFYIKKEDDDLVQNFLKKEQIDVYMENAEKIEEELKKKK